MTFTCYAFVSNSGEVEKHTLSDSIPDCMCRTLTEIGIQLEKETSTEVVLHIFSRYCGPYGKIKPIGVTFTL